MTRHFCKPCWKLGAPLLEGSPSSVERHQSKGAKNPPTEDDPEMQTGITGAPNAARVEAAGVEELDATADATAPLAEAQQADAPKGPSAPFPKRI